MSSITQTPKNEVNRSLYAQRRLRWWAIKVICGSILIGALLFKTIYVLSSYWPFSIAFAQIVSLTGFTLVIYHYILLRRQNKNIVEPSILVTNQGLYRWLRHPMYLADAIWFTGIFMLYANPVTLVVLLVGYVALVLNVLEEDRCLEAVFGDTFIEWKKRTKKLVPLLF